MHHNEPISFSDALNIVETALEYDKWMFEIPYIAFPAAWKIQVIPPFGGAVIRFCVQDKKGQTISVFLDCYAKFSSCDHSYWEIYPGLDGNSPSRFYDIYDTEKLVRGIKTAFDRMAILRRRQIT